MRTSGPPLGCSLGPLVAPENLQSRRALRFVELNGIEPSAS
jgi:hypothetical protein